MHKVIGSLVGTQQTAYINGRYIGQNIRLILDILEYTDSKSVPGLLLCLDFRKAFDSLEWKFMFMVLSKFNFGQSFIKWIRILYNEPNALLKINGYLSTPILQTRGIRQGCPISALLFILCTEILAYKLINSNQINGLKLNINHRIIEYKVLQYADDTLVLLENVEHVTPTIQILKDFEKVSGLALNLGKTEAMWLGANKNCPEKPFDLQWPSTIRYMGIHIGYNSAEIYQLNWQNKLELFQKTLDCWRTRELTIFGRNTIVKSWRSQK